MAAVAEESGGGRLTTELCESWDRNMASAQPCQELYFTLTERPFCANAIPVSVRPAATLARTASSGSGLR